MEVCQEGLGLRGDQQAAPGGLLIVFIVVGSAMELEVFDPFLDHLASSREGRVTLRVYVV